MLVGSVLSFETSVVLAIVTVSISLYLWWSKRCRVGLPPFPVTPFPVVGNLLHLDANPRKKFEKWRKQCGDVYSIYMGQTLVIVVNRYDAVKEALLTYGDYFSDRPTLFMDYALGSFNCGIVTSSGAVWQEQRSASLKIFKQLGMGKNILADKIQEEVGHFLQLMEDKKDAPLDLENFTCIALSNIVCSILIGKRHPYDNPKFQLLVENLSWIAKNVKLTNPLHFVHQLMHLPGDLFKGKRIQTRLSQTLKIFSDYYITQNKDDESRENYITMYLKQSGLNKERGIDTTMTKKQLGKCMLDLLAAGTETTSMTIVWLILYLLHYPKVQEKLQEEIDAQIGASRLPNLSDKSRLPYLNAVIMETQRISSIVPLAITHLCSKTVHFRGYTIPKGANIAPNLDSVLHDEDTWGKDADEFRPERHLDESGNLMTRPEFIPYSIGRRYCLGESIARMELFLFISAMLQKFTFLPEDENNLPSIEGIYGITRNPHPFKVKIVERYV